MAQQSSNKGNPAMKRMQNKALQAKRQRCYLNGQERKRERVRIQKQAESLNRRIRENGGQTRWEVAKEIRYNKRHP